jgi:hypothetical protein
MSRNYKFKNPAGVCFVSFAVVDWIDVFTRNEYNDIFLESLRYGNREKYCNYSLVRYNDIRDKNNQLYCLFVSI